ncbi:MAG: glycosyltransferase family 2 protein [Clostridiaceae bacterium]|jgi:O-antigen biosynthesis protein|nr:glycosyltransferase family 2 protein [Clostridiaceae bacterium]
MNKSVIITLTFNQLESATKPFIDSLYRFTKDFDLIIVDNASTDGTKEFLTQLQTEKDNVKVIFNDKNEGYSKGNNIGLKEALKGDYEFVGLLNNDILFTPDWLEDLERTLDSDNKIGMVSPRINDKCKLTVENYLDGYKKFLSKFKNNIREVVTPYFCCVLMKTEVLNKVGLFDENYTPAYFEDNDLSFRCLYLGYKCIYDNRTFVFHNHSTSCNALKNKNEIFERNRKYFYDKHPLGKYIYEHKRSNLIKDIKRYVAESFE